MKTRPDHVAFDPSAFIQFIEHERERLFPGSGIKEIQLLADTHHQAARLCVLSAMIAPEDARLEDLAVVNTFFSSGEGTTIDKEDIRMKLNISQVEKSEAPLGRVRDLAKDLAVFRLREWRRTL